MIFQITSIWSSAVASKIEAVISSLLNKSFSAPGGFVNETFKVGITNPQGFFDSNNFYLLKFDELKANRFFRIYGTG